MNGTIQTSTNIEITYDLKKSPKIQKLVYETIANNSGIRIPRISELSGLKQTSIDNALRELKKKNLIKYAGSKKDGGYYII